MGQATGKQTQDEEYKSVIKCMKTYIIRKIRALLFTTACSSDDSANRTKIDIDVDGAKLTRLFCSSSKQQKLIFC